MAHHKIPYAKDFDANGIPKNLLEATQKLKPTALIGVSAQPQTFTKEIIETISSYTKNPVVFALSNPTSKAECTAEQAYTWTKGKAIFASGSPFNPVTVNGETFHPGQGNNAYIFPGIGLGVLAAGSKRVTDDDMYIAACSLADQVGEEHLSKGATYPSLNDIREVSKNIAVAIATNAYDTGVATHLPRPKDIGKLVEDYMWDPVKAAKAKQGK